MWRLILLGVVAVAADDRWSRQTTDRRQGDWIPVAAPGASYLHKGRSALDSSASGSGSLPSVLTPPLQQHGRLLPPPPPDGLFQHAATTGFINSFPGQQSLIDKPRQFLPQNNLNNNQQSPFRFKDNPPLTDSTGIPSNLFQVGPQQFTQSSNQQNSQILSAPQFLPPQFIPPPPQRTPLHQFVQFNPPQLLQPNIPFSDFPLQPNQHPFLTQPGNLQLQQPQSLFNQVTPSINQSPGRFSTNITNNYKPELQNDGKDEVQLLYVPVEALRQRGRNFGNVRGNKKVEQSNSNQNSFISSNQQFSNIPIQTSKPFFKTHISDNEQFYKQNQENTAFQSDSPQLHHVIQETTAPQLKYKQTVIPHLLQEQTTYSQLNQQSETVTPSSTIHKYQIDQKQRDEATNVNNQQFAFEQFQRQQFNPDSVTQGKLESPNQNFFQSQQYSNIESFNKPEYQHSVTQEQHTTIPPPHQPPLSVYMETNANSKIGDVLTHLKNAKTIPVLDTIGPDSPQVFVGPSNLHPPSGYLKFELPYLSSLDNNRVERKVDKLPFFVAPLNFQPPPGYSKIPFPAPHIGSVVVSNITILKTALHEKPNEYLTKPEISTPSGIQHYSVVGDISSFSPQLPSLVNSLQDERYFPSSSTTTETPTIAPDTTAVYTTPYRRNPSRGTQRTTKTTDGPTRRPVTRQRRPYGRPNPYRASQVVTTTPESIVATTTPQQYEQTDEQLNFYTDVTTETPQHSFSNQNIKEPVFETNNQNSEFQLPNNQQIYNQQGSINNQQQNDQQFNQNYPQGQLNNNVLQGIIPQLEQVQQYFTQLQQQQYIQGNQNPQKSAEQQQSQDFAQIPEQYPNYNLDVVSQTPQSPVSSENNNYSPNPFNSDAPQELTTEAEIQKVSPHTSESTTVNSNRVTNVRRDPLRQRYRTRNPYQTTTEYVTTTERERSQNVPRRHKTRPSYTQNVQVVKENYPDNFPTNTERLDDQSTERSQDTQSNTYKHDFQPANIQEHQQNYQNNQPIYENDQYYQQQYNIAQLQQNSPVKTEQQSEKSLSSENENFGQVQFENSTPYFSKETTQPSTENIRNSQPVYSETSSKYEDNDHITEKPINQQRLTKYSRVRGRINSQSDQQVNNQHEPSQNIYEGNYPSSTEILESSSVTESEPEPVTTPKPTVRVRGRVRNRQRGNSVRQSTTTEPPNYPIESGLVNNPESHYVKRPTHRKPYADRVSNYNRHSGTRYRNSNAQSSYNDNVENDSVNNHSSTSEENSGSTTETAPVSRRYNHLLNRNIARRPNSNRNVHQTSGTTATTESTPLQSETGTTTRYLVRTTRRPVTQVTKLSDGRSRIRRPNKATLTITTTEDPPINSAEENFAPSAGSNEVLDQYYPSQTNRNHNENNHNLQYQIPNRNPTKHYTPTYDSSTILTPTPFAPSNNAQNLDDYWNQGFTIQQSNSYDFSAESSPATQSTLSTRYNNNEDESEEDDGHYSHKSSSPSWSNPSRTTSNQDQTPYSSNEQYVAAIRNSKTKTKQSSHYNASGKENQWNEKNKEQDSNDQLHQQPDSDIYNRNGDNNEQYNKQISQEEVIINEDQRPVYKQTEETSEDERSISENPSEPQLVYTAAEDVVRTKDGFIQRKPVDPVTGKKSGRRRGAWVRVRVHKKPKDVFETAESQNLASLSNNNAIKSIEVKGTESEALPKEYSIPPNHRPTDPYSTDLPQTTTPTQSTTTETTTTAEVETFQKSITDMIREIIKEEEVEEEAEENRKSQQSTSLNRTITTTISPILPDEVTDNQHITTTTINEAIAVTIVPETVTQLYSVDLDSEGVTTIRDEVQQDKDGQPESRVLGTSTTTEISLETEICYKGRCVKSKKNKKSVKPTVIQSTPELESDLMPVE